MLWIITLGKRASENTNGNPDLSHDRILVGAKEGLYFQGLLDPFEEQFDLPALLVNRRDSRGGQGEIIGDKLVVLCGLDIDIGDTAKV